MNSYNLIALFLPNLRSRGWFMRTLFILAAVLLSFGFAWAETGFDEKYERDYNIFNPVNQYAPDNPLNPAQAYAPDNPFNPTNQYDPGNPVNPTNRYAPNNPFNPTNQYNPDNPLNPANRYNPTTPFAPLNQPPSGNR